MIAAGRQPSRPGARRTLACHPADPGSRRALLTASSDPGGVGLFSSVAAGTALLVSVAAALVARWLVRRHDTRRGTTTTSVQVVARLASSW